MRALVLLTAWLLTACDFVLAIDVGSDGGVDAGSSETGLVELARLGGAPSLTGTFSFACGVRPDGQGGLYVAIDTDTGLDGPARGMRDLVVARLDASGRPRWLRQLGDEGTISPLFTRGCALDVDASGNVYVAGLVNGRGAFLGEPLPALFTALVVSYSADGALRWIRLLGEAGGAEAMGVSVVGDEVRVLGYANGGLAGVAGLGAGDVFFARLAAMGGTVRELWLLGGADEDLPAGLVPEALAYVTTVGVRGPISATVRVPLLTDGGVGTATSMPEGLERLASLDATLITASTASTDAGLVVTLRAFDEQGGLSAERTLPSMSGASLRAFGCGAVGCVVSLSTRALTRLHVLGRSLEVIRTLQLSGVDGGSAPLLRDATVLGDDFVLVGSLNGPSRADAVVWRLKTK